MLSNLKTKMKLHFYFQFTCILKFSIVYKMATLYSHSVWHHCVTFSICTWKRVSRTHFWILFLQIRLLQVLRNWYHEISQSYLLHDVFKPETLNSNKNTQLKK